MNVMVVGATSQIGEFLLPKLVDSGASVFALSRQPQLGTAKIHWSLAAQPPELESLDRLIGCGPLDVLPALITRYAPAGLRQVIAFSSSSASIKLCSAWPEERALAARLQAMEQAVVAAATAGGVAALLLRPTLIYGAGRDLTLSRIYRLARRFRVVPLPHDARGARQPVHAEDLADAVISAIARNAAGTVELGGAQVLTYVDMLDRVVGSVRGPVLKLPLPTMVFRWLGRGMLSAAQIDGMRRDQSVDLRAAQTALDFSPRGFTPSATDFELAG
jgi:nucleoside-diphosphate-sugar epimerase